MIPSQQPLLNTVASAPNTGAATSTLSNPSLQPAYPTGANLESTAYSQVIKELSKKVVEQETSILSYQIDRQDPTSASGTAANQTYTWYLQNYTPINSFYWQGPVQYRAYLVDNAVGTIPSAPVALADLNTAWNTIKTATGGFNNVNFYKAFNWYKNPFARMFSLFQILIGNNAVNVSPNGCDYGPNLYEGIYLPRFFDKSEKNKAGYLVPHNTCGNISVLAAAGAVTTSIHDRQYLTFGDNCQGVDMNYAWAMNAFVYDVISSMLNLTGANINVPKEVTLPFGLFNDVFNQQAYLPPNLAMKVILTYNQQPIPLFSYGNMLFTVTPLLPTATNVNSAPYILYKSITFQKAELNDLNKFWLSSYSNIPFWAFKIVPTNLPSLPAGSTQIYFTLTIASDKPSTMYIYLTDPSANYKKIGNMQQQGSDQPYPNIVYRNLKLEYSGQSVFTADDRTTQNQWPYLIDRGLDTLNRDNFNKIDPSGCKISNGAGQLILQGSLLTLKIDPSNLVTPCNMETMKGPVTMTFQATFGEVTVGAPGAANGANLNAFGTLGPTTRDLRINVVAFSGTQLIINNSLAAALQPNNTLLIGPNQVSSSNQQSLPLKG